MRYAFRVVVLPIGIVKPINKFLIRIHVSTKQMFWIQQNKCFGISNIKVQNEKEILNLENY